MVDFTRRSTAERHVRAMAIVPVPCMVNSGQYTQSSPVMADWGVAESRGAVSCP